MERPDPAFGALRGVTLRPPDAVWSAVAALPPALRSASYGAVRQHTAPVVGRVCRSFVGFAEPVGDVVMERLARLALRHGEADPDVTGGNLRSLLCGIAQLSRPQIGSSADPRSSPAQEGRAALFRNGQTPVRPGPVTDVTSPTGTFWAGRCVS